jgi:hypothetical protein
MRDPTQTQPNGQPKNNTDISNAFCVLIIIIVTLGILLHHIYIMASDNSLFEFFDLDPLPKAIYNFRKALYSAIQMYAKSQGYAVTITNSKSRKNVYLEYVFGGKY